jgi:hypothetical protein
VNKPNKDFLYKIYFKCSVIIQFKMPKQIKIDLTKPRKNQKLSIDGLSLSQINAIRQKIIQKRNENTIVLASCSSLDESSTDSQEYSSNDSQTLSPIYSQFNESQIQDSQSTQIYISPSQSPIAPSQSSPLTPPCYHIIDLDASPINSPHYFQITTNSESTFVNNLDIPWFTQKSRYVK